MLSRLHYLMIAIIAAILAPSIAAAISYNVVDFPVDQNGYSVSGTIETDGTIGELDSSNIVDFSIQISGPNSAFIDMSDSGGMRVDSGVLFATESSLIFMSRVEFSHEFSLRDPDGDIRYISIDTMLPASYVGNVASVPQLQWDTIAPQMDGTNTWVIATNIIPEPTTTMLIAFGLGCMSARGRRMGV